MAWLKRVISASKPFWAPGGLAAPMATASTPTAREIVATADRMVIVGSLLLIADSADRRDGAQAHGSRASESGRATGVTENAEIELPGPGFRGGVEWPYSSPDHAVTTVRRPDLR